MYYKTTGDLLVKQNEVFKEFNLGKWISRQRTHHNTSKATMKQERIQALESIGMVWNANDASWELRSKAAKKYYEEFGNLGVLIETTYDDIKLGQWISNQRTAMKNKDDSHVLTEERIKRLDAIGMIWEAFNTKQVSFPEKALFYYFKKIFPNAIDNDRSLGFEVDVLDKDHGIGMEYDGRIYHQDIYKDYEKNRNAKQYIQLCSGPVFCYAAFALINSVFNDAMSVAYTRRGLEGLMVIVILLVILLLGLLFAIFELGESGTGYLAAFITIVSIAWCYLSGIHYIPHTQEMTRYAIGALIIISMIDQAVLLFKR